MVGVGLSVEPETHQEHDHITTRHDSEYAAPWIPLPLESHACCGWNQSGSDLSCQAMQGLDHPVQFLTGLHLQVLWKVVKEVLDAVAC